MKKVVVGMFALVLCAGMAMADTCKGYNKTCKNYVKSGNIFCTTCASSKAEAERALNLYHRDQSQECATPDYTSKTRWDELDCDNYNNSKSN